MVAGGKGGGRTVRKEVQQGVVQLLNNKSLFPSYHMWAHFFKVGRREVTVAAGRL